MVSRGFLRIQATQHFLENLVIVHFQDLVDILVIVVNLDIQPSLVIVHILVNQDIVLFLDIVDSQDTVLIQVSLGIPHFQVIVHIPDILRSVANLVILHIAE